MPKKVLVEYSRSASENEGDNMITEKLILAYRDTYLDVFNQVLLMNLVARQIWGENPDARECFKEIHRAYNSLKSEDNLRKDIGDDAYFRFFGALREEGKYSYLEMLKAIFWGGQSLDKYATSGSSHYTTLDGYGAVDWLSDENITIFNILDNVFEVLDAKRQFMHCNIEQQPFFGSFLLTLFGRLRYIENTYGFSHKNLYMCLYHFDLMYKNFIPDRYPKSGDKMQAVERRKLLNEMARWIRNATGLFDCCFSRNNLIGRITMGDLDRKSYRDVRPLTIELHDRELKNIDKNVSSNVEEYASKVSNILKDWLRQYLSGYPYGTNMNCVSDQLQEEYELSEENRISRKKREKEEKGKEVKIVQKFEVVQSPSALTSCYALLAYDYCEGAKKGEIFDDTLEGSVRHVEKKYSIISDDIRNAFPGEGITKRVGYFVEGIKQRKFSYIHEEEINIVKNGLGFKGEYFPYPLFFQV